MVGVEHEINTGVSWIECHKLFSDISRSKQLEITTVRVLCNQAQVANQHRRLCATSGRFKDQVLY